MARKPVRLYLFHGNDSRSSLAELQRWMSVFAEKYGLTSRHVLHADEQAAEHLADSLGRIIETNSLFAEPKLVLIKRLNASYPAVKAKDALKVLGERLTVIDDSTTLVLWEDRRLATNAPVASWFTEHINRGIAEEKVFDIPQGRGLIDAVAKGVDLSIEAKQWLERYSRTLERAQRIQAKLRSTEQLVHDQRRWQLEAVIATASLLAPVGHVVRPQELAWAAEVGKDAVSLFEIVNAIRDRQWSEVRTLLADWQEDDESAYFALVALLRNHYTRQSGEEATYALELLAEWEIMSKNVPVKMAWIADLFVCRLQAYAERGREPMVSPRRLWLSHIQRVA